jgi:hypothetical protein
MRHGKQLRERCTRPDCGEEHCEYCDRHWTPEHECYGTRSEAGDYKRVEDDHR